jgi:hypothetical protein
MRARSEWAKASSMKKKTSKPYWEMSAEELQDATKEFDKPVPWSKTRPLTKAERALFEKMRKGRHVSIHVTRGADGMWVRLDPDVMKRSAIYAAKQQITLSELINRSLKGALAIVE